ncbi:MAG TPA: o-succinylbenzoate synthase [Gemmatimonadaceae bacterium]|nr:o-succinylbenzoate synthase [Gemmatimonadaceae bacterium]
MDLNWYTKVVYRSGVPRITLGAVVCRPPVTVPGMLRLERVTLREIRLALKEPFRISSGVESERRILLLALEDADGASTWAECVAFPRPNYTPETIDTAWLAIREWLAPRLLGRPVAAASDVHNILAQDIRGHNMAKAVLEMGCWGLEAEIQREPLSLLLGGTRLRVPTGISLGIQPAPELLVERALAAVAAGYRKIKLKIQPGQDIEYVRAVRTALGAELEIMADANAAYSIDDADHLIELDESRMLMLEQPFGADALLQLAELQRRMTTPLCLDESIIDVSRARDMIALGSGKIINIKPGRVGGFAASKAIHDVCRDAGVPVWCGGMLETGIGRAYNVALASLPNFSMPGDLSPSARYWARDIVSPEWTMDAEGMVHVPRTKPGLGVEIDVDFIESLTTRSEVLSSRSVTVSVR